MESSPCAQMRAFVQILSINPYLFTLISIFTLHLCVFCDLLIVFDHTFDALKKFHNTLFV